jgi:hypothetical protein
MASLLDSGMVVVIFITGIEKVRKKRPVAFGPGQFKSGMLIHTGKGDRRES